MSTKFLLHEDARAWHQIGFDPDKKAINISIHKMAFEEVKNVPWQTAPVIPHLKSSLGLGGFTALNEGDFGFENCMKYLRTDGPWLKWCVVLPNIRSGENSKIAIAIRATFWILFDLALALVEVETDAEFDQLIAITGVCLEQGNSGASLGAYVTPSAVKWLCRQKDEELYPPIVEAMQIAYQQIWPRNKESQSWDRISFRFDLREDGGVHFCVPGNACGLDPTDRYSREGYRLYSHNCDSSLQQLTLIAGIASMHDLMRDNP